MPLEITPQQARAFTLARQRISDPAADPLDAVRSLLVVQTQYDASLPVAVWARTQNLAPGWADRALYHDRSIVKTWTLRSTVHTQAAADLPLLISAIGRMHRERYLEFWSRYLDRTPEQVVQIYDGIRAALSQDGPLTRKQLHEAVPLLRGIPYAGWGVDVKGLAYNGELVFADVKGGQKRFALRERWLAADWSWMDEGEARRELLRRFLRSHGPATLGDFRRWSGQRLNEIRPAAKAMAGELVHVQVTGWPGDFLVLAEDEATLRSPQPDPPPAALLPKFEALLLAYQHPRFFEESERGQLFRMAGQIEAIVLRRDRVVGTWRLERKGKQSAIRVMPFVPLGEEDRRAILEKMADLAAFFELKDPVLEIGE